LRAAPAGQKWFELTDSRHFERWRGGEEKSEPCTQDLDAGRAESREIAVPCSAFLFEVNEIALAGRFRQRDRTENKNLVGCSSLQRSKCLHQGLIDEQVPYLTVIHDLVL
jgi:hypothetical protein